MVCLGVGSRIDLKGLGRMLTTDRSSVSEESREVGNEIKMCKHGCSQLRETSGGHDVCGLSDVDQSAWWAQCCGFLERVERASGRLLKEQKGPTPAG